MEELIFYADQIMAMGNSKNSQLYSNRENLLLAKYTCFTVLDYKSEMDACHSTTHIPSGTAVYAELNQTEY